MNDWETLLADVGTVTKVAEWISSPDVLRAVTAGLRRCAPTVIVHGRAIVTMHADVVEVLGNDRDFGVTEIYAQKMKRTTGAFFLGMENSDAYRREATFARSAVHDGDFSRMRELVFAHAEELATRARVTCSIDAVAGFSHLIPLRLLRDYFGLEGRDWVTLARWMRTIFWDIFLNFTDDRDVSRAAQQSSRELATYLSELIARRQRELDAGRLMADDFVSRLVRERARVAGTFDDDAIRRTVGGVVVGAVDTQSKAMCHAIQQLLENPAALRGATRAARDGDRDLVGAYVWEALRFNPHNPLIVRYCRDGAVIGRGTEREIEIPPATTVYASTLSAMFDDSVVDEPSRFRAGRPRQHYLHFGHGQHRCFGERINAVVIPEAIRRLLLLKNLRIGSRGAARVAYQGPFPTQFPLEFDRD